MVVKIEFRIEWANSEGLLFVHSRKEGELIFNTQKVVRGDQFQLACLSGVREREGREKEI